MAVSVAAELSSINYRDTAITLTPSDTGRFEVYLDGKKVYDRKEAGAVDFLPALREIHKIRDNIKQIFADSPPAPAAAGRRPDPARHHDRRRHLRRRRAHGR